MKTEQKNNKKTNVYSFRLTVGEKRPKFTFHNKRTMERFQSHIAELMNYRRYGGELPDHLFKWLADMQQNDPKTYDRLHVLGLCNKRKGVAVQTLETLYNKFVEVKKAEGMKESTLKTYGKPYRNLCDFFGADRAVKSIDKEDAMDFFIWINREAVNRRVKDTQKLAEATINKRLVTIKEFFNFARKCGWITENPFSEIKTGKVVNKKNWVYLPKDTVEKLMKEATLETALIIALGRFCGLRGASELGRLTWGDVERSHTKDGKRVDGKLIVHCTKTERHGKPTRVVPLPENVEELLQEQYDNAKEGGEGKIFSKLTTESSVCMKVRQLATRVFGYCWADAYYNLRKSYCSDLGEQIGNGLDVATYEAVTGHKYEVAREHYQIMHEGRQERGFSTICNFFGKNGGNTENTTQTGDNSVMVPSGTTETVEDKKNSGYNFFEKKEKKSAKLAQMGGIEITQPVETVKTAEKSIHLGIPKNVPQCNARKRNQESKIKKTLEITDEMHIKKPACTSLQVGSMGATELESVTSAV